MVGFFFVNMMLFGGVGGSVWFMFLCFIVFDFDGILLCDDFSVSFCICWVLDVVWVVGIYVVLVMVWQLVGVWCIVQGVGFDGWVLCSNGVFGIYLMIGEVLFECYFVLEMQWVLVEVIW